MKWNVYYRLEGLNNDRYVLVKAIDPTAAKYAAKPKIEKIANGKSYQLTKVEESKGFYI